MTLPVEGLDMFSFTKEFKYILEKADLGGERQ